MPRLPLTIQFGASGDYQTWASEGWSRDPNEVEHTWIVGHVAKLQIFLEFSKHDRFLEIDLILFRPHGIVQERIIYLNGGFVTFWPVKAADKLSARIESALFHVGENIFAFVVPKAVCPKEAGVGDDERVLGVAFRSLHLADL